ncbi:sugar phosphate isomerase/epimerase family protein [Candidatus Latescibacterota bacterium]
MSKTISRRKALTAGAAATGVAASGNLLTGCASTAPAPVSKDQAPLPNVWGEDFMMQWTPPENVKRDLTPGPTPIRISCAQYGLRLGRRRGRGGAAQDENATTPSIGDVVRGIREAGYTAAEAPGNSMNDLTDSQVRELQAALKEHDVEFYTIHVWTNLTHPDPEIKERNIQMYITNIEAAERVGVKNIVMHTGGADPRNQDRPHPMNWSRALWEEAVANTKRVIDATPGSTINLGFEAVNSHNNNTPQSHVRLKEDVGSDRVKVTLDPTNMFHPGVYFRSTELINTCFELIGEDVVCAHAKDTLWTSMVPGLSEGYVLGEGVMDYEVYLTHLSRMKYPRCLLIEHLREPEMYDKSHAFVKETAARLGVKIYS